MEVGGQSHAPTDLPPEKTQWGGSQGWFGRVRKISLQPGLDPRTAQSVVSRYAD